MRKVVLIIVLALLAAAAFSGAAVLAAGTGRTGGAQFETALAVRTAGATLTTAQKLRGEYAYEVNFRTAAAAPDSNVLSVDLGAGEGTHALRLTIQARGVIAYVISNETGLGSGVAVSGDFDFPIMTTSAMGWMQLGIADFKFKFVTSADWSRVNIFCAQQVNAYPAEPNGFINLSDEADESKDYRRLKPTDGAVRLLPDLHTSFYVNSVTVNGTALNLRSGDAVLSGQNHFSDRYNLSEFAVDATASADVKAVSPFQISTEGFAENDEVFSVSYDIRRGKTDGAQVWTTTADFGLLFGLKSAEDGYQAEGVGSILNGADYTDYNGSLSSGYTVMVVGRGNGTTADKLNLVGRHNADTGAGTQLFNNNELPTGNVRVSAVGYGDGRVTVTYTEAVGHDTQVITACTVTGFNLNGYMALYCRNETINENDEIRFHNISFTVNEYVMPDAVTLDKAAITVKSGETGALIATVTPADVTDSTVLWESDNPAVAAVNSSGVVTGIAYGTARITAKCAVDTGKAAYCAVTVLEPVTGVSLNKTVLALNRSQSEILTATVAPADRCDATVFWESDNEEVATVNSDGVVTAAAKGRATITARTADGGFTADCAITVSQPATGIELDRETASLREGGTVTLTATVFPVNADDKTIAWESDNPAVARVEGGAVTAVSAGSATITARCGALTATCVITVKSSAIDITGITLNETVLSLKHGETFALKAKISPDNATDKTVAYKSDREDVLTVSADGVITAHQAGTAVVTVTAGGKTATCTVTVTEENEEQPASCGCGTLFTGGLFRWGWMPVAALAAVSVLLIKRKLVRCR